MKYIEDISKNLEYKINRNMYNIEFLPFPHIKPTYLKKGYSAVYIFIYNDTFLKIGKANSKSTARFCNQHYNPNSCQSNLAKALLNDEDFKHLNLNVNNISEWIQKNLTRINIMIDNKCGKAATELIESILHYKYRPKYEGNI